MIKEKLGNIVSFQRGYDLTHGQMKGGNIPVVGSSEVIGWHNVAKSEAPTLLIGRSGTVGRPQYYNCAIWPHNTTLFVTDFHGNNPRYCYYLLRNLNLEDYASSSGVPTLNRNFIEPLQVKYHKREEQDKIVKILTALDGKISTNNKIIETSEKLMREIYDYWFVQFDFPDKNARPYKSSGGEMVYNETLKREIPEGWRVTTLGESYDIYQPGILSAKQCDPDGEYDVHGSNGIIGRYHEYNHEDSEIIISCRGDCGNIHRVMPKTWITGNAMVIKPKAETTQSREYLKNMLGTLGIKNISTGSVQGQITRTNLAPIKIVVPDNDILEKYAELADSSSELVIKTTLENRKLEELRDWLLPMLMNGQIRVSD